MTAQTEYFNKLNYSLANEDTTLEGILVERLRPKKILTVCGSGGRSIPLALCAPEKIVCSDLAQEQLWLAEMRLELFRKLDRNEFLIFFGLPPYDKQTQAGLRKEIFEKLTLSPPVKEFFTHFFNETHWEALTYKGKWEKTFQKISSLVRFFIGDHSKKIFEFTDIADQKRYWNEDFPKFRWTLALMTVGNASFFNALLYKGHFAKKNIPESHFDFYKAAYGRIFETTLARENFFAQLSFLGQVTYPEGVPFEANPAYFQKIKDGIKQTKFEFRKEDINSIIKKGTDIFDFVSYSDVPSYFSGETEKEFLQWARPGLAPNARVVLRHYLRVPENMNLSGFVDETSSWTQLVNQEKTQMYKIQILRRLE